MIRTMSLVTAWLVSVTLGAAAATLSNQLTSHPSPYLAMHAEDPVHWQLWNEETLKKARRLNRPLLVSIGYFACHWCHVMQRESYRDPAIASLLNDHFIPVKVDRELEPALDSHLMEFVELTRGQAGWPLHVLLTPDGYPIAGFVYQPRQRFYAILEDVRRRWEADPQQLAGPAKRAMVEWRDVRTAHPRSHAPDIPFAQNLRAQAARRADELAGGFGHAAKFPMAAQLQALLSLSKAASDAFPDDFLRLTLDQMADLGLHDLLGGGFFRYVIDPVWQVPHFEKMLYDNAQLAVLYLAAGRRFDSPRYRELGLETLDFMLGEMLSDEGYFISSFSAVDDRGREGYYYLWDQASLEQALDEEELRAVQAAWFSSDARHFEYGRLPRWQERGKALAARLGWARDRVERTLSSARRKLLSVRATRSLPADKKGLAAWNGLALSALAAGYAATGGARYGEPADRLASYLANQLWDGERLARAREGARVLAEASLEDYAFVAGGLWDWHQQKPAGHYADLAEQLVRIAWRRHFKDRRWVETDTPLIPMLGGRIASEDGPLPSATAVISHLTAVHPGLQADEDARSRLGEHLEDVRTRLGDAAFWYASYLELIGPDQSSR
jgi:uncharacterized protein YyaL (SSP411 family)